ncbi:hypothetical protein Tco_0548663 [Tanacetum coccineum]
MTEAEIDDTLKRLNAEEKVHREKSSLYNQNILRGDSAIETIDSWKKIDFPVFSEETNAYLRSYEPSDDEPQHAVIRGEPPRPYKHSPPKETISMGERSQSYKQSLPKDTIRTGTRMSTSTGSIIEAEPAKAENSSQLKATIGFKINPKLACFYRTTVSKVEKSDN